MFNPIANSSSVNSLLQSSFPPKTSNAWQNFLRFDVKESSYGPDLKESFPGNFPPNTLQLMKNQPISSRKSQVPTFPLNQFATEIVGPSAMNLRQFQSNAKRVNIYKPSINQPNYLNIPNAVRSSALPVTNRNTVFSPQAQPQKTMNEASGRREHITGPSALFSQLPSTMKSYMGIETPNTRQLFPARSALLRQNSAPLPVYNDPRWFSWTQGLAQTSGKTHTNTHSNSLQKNDPGTVATDTHVVSSQGSQGNTNVKQMYPFANLAYMYNPEEAKKIAILRNLRVLQQENADTRQSHTQVHNHQWGYGNGNGKGHGVGTPGASGSGGGWGTGGPLSQDMNLPAWNGDKPPEPDNSQPKPAQPEPAQQKARFVNSLQNIAMHSTPPEKMEIWNAYLAAAMAANKRQSSAVLAANKRQYLAAVAANKRQYLAEVAANKRQLSAGRAVNIRQFSAAVGANRRQSSSNANAITDNTSSSGVSITPTNGNQVTGSNHNWGFGNGNGDGHGTGAPGGDGSGGGWGAGGPTKTKLQVYDPNQRNIVNSWNHQVPPYIHVNVPENIQNAYKKSMVSMSPFLRYIQNTLPYASMDLVPRVVRETSTRSLNANFMNSYKPFYVDYTSQSYFPKRRKISRKKRSVIRTNPLRRRKKKTHR